jgi:hypothetical protein
VGCRLVTFGGGRGKLTVDQEVGGSTPPSCTNSFISSVVIRANIKPGTRQLIGAAAVQVRILHPQSSETSEGCGPQSSRAPSKNEQATSE